MKIRITCALFLLLCLSLSFAVSAGRAAGGGVQGKVTDPKGATIEGATVTVTDPVTNQTFTAITDKQGQYKIGGLPAGVYSIVVSAPGFSEGRNDSVKVDDGGTATVEFKLDIAPVEATVTVSTVKGNSDPTYQELRQQAKTSADFTGPFATVHDLVIKRDRAVFTLHNGQIYFTPAVKDRVFSAVFIGEGELQLTPPTAVEKHTLSLFTHETSITEKFSKLVMHFTDKTFDQIKASPQAQMGTNGPAAGSAQNTYHENQELLRKTLRVNLDLRKLVDLYNPQRPGFFTAFIDGKRYNKLVFQYDPLGIPAVSPEEVLLLSFGETDGGLWTAFHRQEEYAAGTASSDEDHRIYDITHHEIDTVIKATKITSTDTITFRQLDNGARVLPFDLFPSLRVSHVRDEKGRDLDFVQENKNDDADFAIIFPEPLEAGKTYKLTVEYSGTDAIIQLRSGNFFLLPRARSTWYPNNEGTAFADRATFDTTYHYSKGKDLVGTGKLATALTTDSGMTSAKWSTGEIAVAVDAFNYGAFKKKETHDQDTGYDIEFYASLIDAIQPAATIAEDPNTANNTAMAGGGSVSTSGMGGSMIADAENATRLYSAYFGKLPFTRLALTEQPAPNFGQAWPTLVYMPFTAFLDETQRYMATGSVQNATNDFFKYVAPHEIAHQWWGHLVGWKSYHDQWMSEGFAEFSASLYVEQIMRDHKRFIDFWNDQHDLITQARPQTNDKVPYTVGPVTQGYRLNSGKTGGVARFMIYPKGAYILHMLRMMMVDQKSGDRRFMAMMQDFIKSHYNQDISTEDFKKTVEKFMTKQMDVAGNGQMDWFFNEYVYGTEMPSYKFEYQLNGNTLSGKITQSGVSENFAMLVPVYVDYGKGWIRIGAATITGNSSTDLTDIKLPQTAKRATICANDDVLALHVETGK